MYKFREDFSKFKKGDVAKLTDSNASSLLRRGLIEPASKDEADKAIQARIKRTDKEREELRKAKEEQANADKEDEGAKGRSDKEVKSSDIKNK